MKKNQILVLFILAFFTFPKVQADSLRFKDGIITLRQALVISIPRPYKMPIFVVDPVESSLLSDQWSIPEEGDEVKLNNDSIVQWARISPDDKGWFRGQELRNAWVYMKVESNRDEKVLLEGMGHNMVYVNGVPRIGNKYQSKENFESWEPKFNFSLLPVKLKKGENEFLFSVGRGRLKVLLHELKKETLLNVNDLTLPDFRVGEEPDFMGAVVVINAGDQVMNNFSITVSGEGLEKTLNPVPVIQPMSVRKVGFRLKGPIPSEPGEIKVQLELKSENVILDSKTIVIRKLDPSKPYKRTFVSSIDGSIQYYAVNPASNNSAGKKPALVLSVHGASVEAINQASAYESKSWANIVCPTNRRPYGYDWEDWGRIDALEVLDIAKKTLLYDSERVYLTGHSMGGHGTWILGATYPDKFAAIGPSAGWISWWSYGFRDSRDETPMGKIFARANMPIQTYALDQNFKQLGVYIIHGSEDDNVPVDQSTQMVKHLEKFHHDFVFHEQPGAGHWWDVSKEPGTDCVDWAPLFDFFARHAIAGKGRIRKIDFSTANPGVSATNNWLTIESQMHPLQLSRAQIQFDPGQNLFFGTTENIKRLSFDPIQVDLTRKLTINLDSQVVIIDNPANKKLWLEQKSGNWIQITEPSKALKGPHRYGMFKDAFSHHVILVLGTHGTRSENNWMAAKARYDAENFWYQGNGSVDIIKDVEFDSKSYKDRNVIIYGNSHSNTAWKKLLQDCPVQVTQKTIQIGDKILSGTNLAILFIYPRKDSKVASVGVVGGTGLAGMKLNTNLPYLAPGFGFPDFLVLSGQVLNQGREGIEVAGFFGNDWSIETGDFVWKKNFE